jgi:tetrahydromethanopterin S-methyltransferase subunit H
MFSFTKNQKIIQIGNIRLGGQPGNLPTVLMGGLFFSGVPDFAIAKKAIEDMYTVSEKTGNPAIADFFIKKNNYIDDILAFISSTIPNESPFSIDVTDPEVKINVLKKLDEQDLLKRTIYNSIHVGLTDDEIVALQNHCPQAAILVAFNPKDTSPDGKIEVLETGAHVTPKGLLRVAEECNIPHLLIDTAALAPGQNSGASIAALPVIKEEYGLPAGCSIHNVVEKSTWLNQFPNEKRIVDCASNININLFGGDFAIFGSIKHAKTVFPIISWQDILISEYTEHYFGITPDEKHPRRILFQ